MLKCLLKMSDIFIELLYLISDKVCYFAIVCAFAIPANVHKRPGKKAKIIQCVFEVYLRLFSSRRRDIIALAKREISFYERTQFVEEEVHFYLKCIRPKLQSSPMFLQAQTLNAITSFSTNFTIEHKRFRGMIFEQSFDSL